LVPGSVTTDGRQTKQVKVFCFIFSKKKKSSFLLRRLDRARAAGQGAADFRGVDA
jgi:ribosomal protein L18E